MKQTSIEWLDRWFRDNPEATHEEGNKALQQAKQIHKAEIIEAYNSGDSMHYEKHPLLKDVDKDGHEYYNQTYGGNK